jgi:hypothetical protein
MGVIEETKELLSESRFRIKLHDLVATQVREVIPLISDEQFPSQGNWSDREFVERLKKYEGITANLCGIQALLAYWGTKANRETLTLPIKQICGRLKPVSGVIAWIRLRWYPALLLLYVGGIAAVAAGKYDNLQKLLQANISDPEQSYEGVTLIRRISDALKDIEDKFKIIPGYERQYTPRSQYLLQLLQPTMDDLLFCGIQYESHFDRFEVLLALEHAEQYAREQFGRVWGPVGRFGWKFRRRDASNPLHQVVAEAEAQGDSWPPILAGLFKSSANRFKEIASEYSQQIAQLGWW